MEVFISEKARGVSPSPTLAIDAKFKRMKSEGKNVIGFGAGEPDFDTPQNIKEAAIRAINDGLTKYTPSSGIMPLRKAICDKLKSDNNLSYEPGEIIVSCGAKHSLSNIFMAICDSGDEVIIPAPYWVSYPEQVRLSGGVPVIVRTLEENNFKITPDELKSAITSRTRAVIINSPNNPTGSVYSKSELEKLAEVASEEGIYIVSDEIYEKLNFEGEHASIATISPEIKKLTIVVNGFSKAYAMTGWRVGYAACEKSLALAMGNIQSHQTSNPNSIAQIAALEALSGDQSIISEMKAEYLKRMDYMTARINKIPGLSCLRPAGALYVFMNISKLFGKNHYGKIIDSSSEFCDNLLKISEVALVPSEGFGMDGYARLSFATSMGNIREGLDRIEKYVGGIE